MLLVQRCSFIFWLSTGSGSATTLQTSAPAVRAALCCPCVVDASASVALATCSCNLSALARFA